MSSTNESNYLSGMDQNYMQSISQLQQPAIQVTEPYWNPNFNHFGMQWRYPFAPFPFYPAPIIDWMPLGTPVPYYETYQPPAPYLQQFDPRVLVPAPIPQMSIHQSAPNSQILMDPIYTENSPPTYETQDLVEPHSVSEPTYEDRIGKTADEPTRMTSASLAAHQLEADLHPSAYANLDSPSIDLNASSTCDTQHGAQDLPSQPQRACVEDTPRLDSKPQKRNWLKCECPNCNVEGGNQVRHGNGDLLHACHIAKCGKFFNRPASLRQHLESHRNPSVKEDLLCDNCDMRFANKTVLRKHMRSHNKNSKLGSCQYPNCAKGGNKTREPNDRPLHACTVSRCKSVFLHTSSLRRHLQECHSDKKSTLTETPRLKGTFLLETEKAQKQKYEKCQCPNCKAKGGNQNRYPNGTLQHVCHVPGCGRVFNRPAYLMQHLDSHKTQGGLFSAHLNKESGSKIEFQHLERDRVEKKFFCAHCGKGFALKYVLGRHVKRHMNVQCDRPKNQVTQITLPTTIAAKIEIKNIMANIGPTPTCPINGCGKVYSTLANLKIHLQMHYDLKPHVCACGKAFTHECYLRRHVRGRNGTQNLDSIHKCFK